MTVGLDFMRFSTLISFVARICCIFHLNIILIQKKWIGQAKMPENTFSFVITHILTFWRFYYGYLWWLHVFVGWSGVCRGWHRRKTRSTISSNRRSTQRQCLKNTVVILTHICQRESEWMCLFKMDVKW